MASTQFLDLDGNKIAYDDTNRTGEAGTILCVPGIGDVRQVYRHVTPLLVGAGYRVLTMDLRGHGDSSVDWPSYRPHDVGADIVALLDHLGLEEVVVVGNSMTAASAVWAAAERPGHFSALVLTGPFVRDLPVSALQRLLLAAGFARPFASTTWGSYYRKSYPTAPPSDLDEHVGRVVAGIKVNGTRLAVKEMMRASKRECEARIADVAAQVLVVMGTKDPDFPDPEREAFTVGDLLNGEVVMVEGAGHYPMAEMPGDTTDAVTKFLSRP